MRSAIRRGLEILNEPELGSVQSQGKTAESAYASASEHMEGIGWIPENVTQLKPVIDKLMHKVNMVAI